MRQNQQKCQMKKSTLLLVLLFSISSIIGFSQNLSVTEYNKGKYNLKLSREILFNEDIKYILPGDNYHFIITKKRKVHAFGCVPNGAFDYCTNLNSY